MIDFISTIKETFEVTERNIGNYAIMKKSGMTLEAIGMTI